MHGGYPYLLTLLIVLPAAGALVTGVFTRVPRAASETIGIVVSVATFALAVAMVFAMHANVGGYQLVYDHAWVRSLGISWDVGVDGISLFLVLLTAVLFPIVLAGARAKSAPRPFVAWMLLLEAACMGSFLSLDLVVFFFFFELTLIPAYFLVSGWGYEHRAYAALKFFLYTLLGSAFLFVGILVVAFLHEQQTHVLTFELPALVHTHFTSATGILLFCAFTAAFAVKAPLFPLHTWSPDAYTEAPTAGSVILAAVLAKLGTYGIIRFDLNLFPRASVDLAPVVLTLAVIGILYGAAVACAQRDLKRIVAYSSLAQVGFIVLGTFAFNTEALTGSVLLMLNHGLIVAGLFLLIGWLAERRGTWQTTALRGLQAAVPVMAAVFTVIMMASIGLPGLNGFVSEFLVLAGTFLTHRWWAVVATFGVVVAALYLLWAYQQVFHGPSAEVPGPDAPGLPAPVAPGAVAVEARARTRDLTWGERLAIAPLVVLIVALGVYPKPALDRINPSVRQLVAHVQVATGTPPPAVGGVRHLPGVAEGHPGAGTAREEALR